MPLLLEGAQALRPLRTFVIPFGATSTTATGPFSAKVVRVHSTAAVCIDFGQFGSNGIGTAATTDFPMSSEQTEYILTATALTWSMKARDSGAAGVIGYLYVTECN